MQEEDERAGTLRFGGALPVGSRLVAALGLAGLMAMHHVPALAEPIYYLHMQGYGIWEEKFVSAAAACEHYRAQVQKAHDDAGATGGVTIITKLPSEDLYPNLITTDTCKVNWTWPYSSWNYSVGVIAGGCLPGRRPKEDVREYFAEPGDCEPNPCPVPPLSDAYESDPCSLSLEKGGGKDVDHACPPSSILDDPLGEPCLRRKLSNLKINYSGPT
jgi:hypothetical protein